MAELTYLLDTNVVSEPVKPEPDPKVLKKIREHQLRLAISAITWHELLFGFQRAPEGARRRDLEQYLARVVAAELPILSYDEPAASWHANQRATLAASGKPRSFPDGQIAAVAAVNHLILVTRNVSDYRDFTGLQIENWFSR